MVRNDLPGAVESWPIETVPQRTLELRSMFGWATV